ncbi:MAG: peptide chain release factor N(5)-glutamine methyltransferase [Alphaproteobacteria bacterium]|nr:peptide chain release factor N(5)-glutamine methyltransferase [Alphaproteobacteria bacterium]
MKINQAFAILQKSGGIRAARIITENTKKLSQFRVWHMAHQLRCGVPVAKIIHKKWFYGLPFYTNRHTLDPRPDTETLVAAVIADITPDSPPRILDLGTGTGCIICSLVKNIPGATGIAIDKSHMALRVARYNIQKLGLAGKINTVRASFDKPHNFHERFDIIVSNPPYIATTDPRVNTAATHDPKMALYASDNGLAAYRSIAKNAHYWLKDNGKLYLEIGIDQGTDIKNIFMNNGWNLCRSESDLAGIERILIFTGARP